MNVEEIRAVLGDIRFYNYSLKIEQPENGSPYLQATYVEADIVSGNPQTQHTRKWQISPHMTKSEIVQTAFKCCLTSMEHRAREHFRYKGAAVYGPHFDVDALRMLCVTKQHDYRTPAPVTACVSA
jgi:hypothetical protein